MAIPSAILGLDLGSFCGWAEIDAKGGRVQSGHWRLGTGRARWGNFRGFLGDRVAAAVFEAGAENVVVCHESVDFQMFKGRKGQSDKGSWAAVYYGLRAHVGAITLQHSVACYGARPNTWKKIAVGKGNASKPLYIAAANERYGLDLDMKVKGNEDEAAALGVAYACYIELGGEQRPITGEQVTL